MSLYTTNTFSISGEVGTFTTSAVVTLYDNCYALILSNVTPKVASVNENCYFQINNSPTPLVIATTNFSKIPFTSTRVLTIGVLSSRVGGQYLHLWATTGSGNNVNINVTQILRSMP